MGTLSTNKRARYDYDLKEEFEAGLKLTGAEVKSVKGGHAQLDRSHIFLRGEEAILRGCHVSPYKPAGKQEGYNPERDRKLLLRKKEIQRMIGKAHEAGLTFVPISLYTKGDLIKLSFALARGKRKFEKREAIKKRDVTREMFNVKRET